MGVERLAVRRCALGAGADEAERRQALQWRRTPRQVRWPLLLERGHVRDLSRGLDLLENFAGANKPPRPIAGQLWFDSTAKKIKAYDGNTESVFVPLGNVHIGAKPTGAAITAANVNKGDLWWDDSTSQLYAHTGAPSGDPFALMLGLHYMIDTVGSRNEYTK